MEYKRLFGTNGIRGIVNKDLTPEFCFRLGLAVGEYFGENALLLIGYDGRYGSSMIFHSLCAGIISTGCEVHVGGYTTTPMLQYSIKSLGYDGGVMITASHNPPEFNGIKVMASDGIELDRESEIKIEKLFHELNIDSPKHKLLHAKVSQEKRMLPNYISAIEQALWAGELIKSKSPRVVVDPGNGVSVLTTPQALIKIGCKVTTVNSVIDPSFPGRLPEPVPENLTAMRTLLETGKFDIGVAHDGDGDRCIAGDKRDIYWGDVTLILLATYILEQRGGGKIVTPISTPFFIEEAISNFNGKVVWTRVGSITVSRTLVAEKAVCGGEENGGFMYPDLHPVRDGTMTSALLLQMISEYEKSLSDLIEERVPKYVVYKTKFKCPNEKKDTVMERIMKLTEGENRITIDGVKVFGNNWAFLIRPSGTEPIIRCFIEAKDDATLEKAFKKAKGIVEKALAS